MIPQAECCSESRRVPRFGMSGKCYRGPGAQGCQVAFCGFSMTGYVPR
jgi:hypothetical protein